MSNRYSAKQATDAIASLDLDALSPKEIEASLKNIISQLDTTPFNTSNSATTVLYSGTSVEDIKDNPKFRVLDNTEAYKFLMGIEDNRPLMNALEKAYGEKPDFRDWTSKAGIFIGGDDRVTPRVGGAWDWVSANFVQEAQGNVVTKVGEGAGVNRVFFGTEIPGAKANPNITHIDHVEKDTLFKELDALGDPQHQLNHFKTITYTREEVFNILQQEPNDLIHHPAEVIPRQIESVLGSKNHYGPAIQDRIDTFKLESFTKAEVSKASGIDHDTISDTQIKTFLSSQTPESKKVLDKIENHRHTLSQHNPRMQHFDIYSHGKYAILGGVAGSILATEDADASTIPNPHLPKDSFENLSTHEQTGAQVSAGFNAINAIQASEEFKAGASKSAKVLLDPRAYKQGIEEATQAWKPNPTQEVVKLSTMESAKFAGKSALKKLPLIGLGAGIAFGIGRAMDGDFNGAAMEIASGAASIVPGWGTAASVGIDAALLEKDTHLLSHGVDKIIGKEAQHAQEPTVQSEDNHSTRAPSQEIPYNSDAHELFSQSNLTKPLTLNNYTPEERQAMEASQQKMFDEIHEKYGASNQQEYEESLDLGMD